MNPIKITLILFIFLMFAGTDLVSQEVPPPPGNKGASGNKAPGGGGGGAPVDGGMLTFTLLVGVYSGYKWIRYRSAKHS